MANFGRKLGANIFSLMQNAGISREEFAEKLNYSYRDACRITEGKLLLTPVEICKIAELFNISKTELLNYQRDNLAPELQFMKEFDSEDNLDKILDLLDEYVELREVM